MGLFDKIKSLFSATPEDNDGCLVLNNKTKVAVLRKQFNERFGSVLRVYQGRSQVDDNLTLKEAGLSREGTFECRGNMHVGTFITRMAEEYGLKVKVYTVDEWVAVIDDLTLTASGLVKKNATKKDMEKMLSDKGEIDEAALDWAELLWNPVNEELLKHIEVKMKKSGNYAWFDGNACRYVMCYIASRNQAKVFLETVDGEDAKNIIDAKVESAPQNHILKQTVLTQSSRNKNKFTWVIENKVDKSEGDLIKWYAETLVAFYEFMESAGPKMESAPKNVNVGIEEDVEAEAATAAPALASVKANKKDGELPGVFTLKDGRKICFSKGNLQFHCKNYEFKFAEEQYETLGKEANEKCAPAYDGWIDIFGWGTSGYMGCQPTERGTTLDQYGPKTGDLTGDNANFDWGVYNPITNGGNKEGLWRTPSKEELLYLLKERPDADRLRLSRCYVCGKVGAMLLPDNFWSNRLRFPIDITSDSNSFNEEQWKILESLGVVFFPKHFYKFYEKYCWSLWDDANLWTSNNQTRVYMSSGSYNDGGFAFILPVRLIKDLK